MFSAKKKPDQLKTKNDLLWDFVEGKAGDNKNYLELLLKEGADPHCERNNDTPLSVAIRSQPWIATVIVENPKFTVTDCKQICYALFEAFNLRKLDIAKKIIQTHPDIHAWWRTWGEENRYATHMLPSLQPC